MRCTIRKLAWTLLALFAWIASAAWGQGSPGGPAGGDFPIRTETMLLDGTQAMTGPLGLEIDNARTCGAGDTGLTYHQNDQTLEWCEGATKRSWPVQGTVSFTAVVAPSCDPLPFGAAPCYSGATSIQDAIDALETSLPAADRTVWILPGVYVQQFNANLTTGRTHIHCFGGLSHAAAGDANVQIRSPVNSTADVNWHFREGGSIRDCSFHSDEAIDGEVGLRVETGFLTEMNWSDVTVQCDGLGAPNIHCVEYTDGPSGPGFGFLTIQNTRILQNCNALSAGGATLYVEVKDGALRELHHNFGYLQMHGTAAVADCRALEVVESPTGDDASGININFVHMQCENNSTCVRADDQLARIDLGPVYMRDNPPGRFFQIAGTGTGSEITLHGIFMREPVADSDWQNVVPEGHVTIWYNDGTLTEPCFPGWLAFNRLAAAGASPFQACRRNAGDSAWEWAAVQLAP